MFTHGQLSSTMRPSMAYLTPEELEEVDALQAEHQGVAVDIFRRAPKEDLVRVPHGHECEPCAAIGMPCYIKNPDAPRGRGRPRTSCEACFIRKPKCTLLNKPRVSSRPSTLDDSASTKTSIDLKSTPRHLRSQIAVGPSIRQEPNFPRLRRSVRSQASTTTSNKQTPITLKIKLGASPYATPSPGPSTPSYYPNPSTPSSDYKSTPPSSSLSTPPAFTPKYWAVGYPRRRIDEPRGSLVSEACAIPKFSIADDFAETKSTKRKRRSSTPPFMKEDSGSEKMSRSLPQRGRKDYWRVVMGCP